MEYERYLSAKVQSLQPSGIRRFFDILNEMKGAISLSVGEPDFQTPWHIRDAGIYSLEKGFTKYTPNAGLSDLRDEISAYLERRFALRYDPKSELLVTVGGSEAIDLAVRSLINPGDEVLIPEPSFVCYGPIAVMAGGTPVMIPLTAENEFRLSPAQLEAAITPRSKLLVLPFPCNPTGGIMERADLELLAPIIEKHDLMVVSDEIYAELTYGGVHHTSIANLPGMAARTVVVNGMSKCYSMTGWRMGYAAAPAPIIKQMTKLHQYCIMSAPTTSQYAAIEALRRGDDDIEAMKEEYDSRRRYLVSALREQGLDCFDPKGAFYAFPSIRKTGLSSEQFCERFLLEHKIACVPGSAFGPSGEGFIRVCYAASMQNMEVAMDRLGQFLRELGV